MSQISSETKSFIILFAVAFFGVLVSLMFSTDPALYTPDAYNTYTVKNTAKPIPENTYTPVDNSTWQTYTNKELSLSFKYKPDWKMVAPVKKNGFTIVQVDPGQKYYNMKIYVSPKEFYVLDGLPAKSETIGGAPALNVSNALYGIRANNLYYTFDIGLSMTLLPEFNALVHSADFGN